MTSQNSYRFDWISVALFAFLLYSFQEGFVKFMDFRMRRTSALIMCVHFHENTSPHATYRFSFSILRARKAIKNYAINYVNEKNRQNIMENFNY